MNEFLGTADYIVIGIYFAMLVGLGFYLSRKASASLEDYFLGGRKLPWWALGISGMASFLDITGTMVIVSFLFMLGPRGLFIEFRGGAVLVLAIMLVFSGKWHRRSGVMTGAEWMAYRFGEGAGGQFARIVSALAAMMGTVGGVAYLSKGVGAFLSMFLPFSPLECAAIMIGVATLYTMMSGFYGVVYTDMVQSIIILIAVFTISIMAIMKLNQDPEPISQLAQSITSNSNWNSAVPHWKTEMPEGYTQYSALMAFMLFYLVKNILGGVGCGADPKYFGARSDRECGKLTLLWTILMMVRWPMMMGFAVLGMYLVKEKMPDRTTLKDHEVLIKQYLLDKQDADNNINLLEHSFVAEAIPPSQWESALKDIDHADPAVASHLQGHFGDNWKTAFANIADQRKDTEERIPKNTWDEQIAKIIKNPEAYPDVVAPLKADLGDNWEHKLKLLSYEGTVNPEKILPAVILFDIPIGFRGLLLVALLAASMSTFDTGLNMGAAYFTRDIYQRYFRQDAKNRELMFATYAFIILIVLLGFYMGYKADNINDIWGWLTMGLGAGVMVPGMLKFFWWRFNSGGLVFGTLFGVVGAVLQRIFIPELDERYQFLLMMGIGLFGCIAGTFLSRPDSKDVVEHFYKTTRPFGFWGPFKAMLDPETRRAMEREHRNDFLALPFALCWQITLFMMPMEAIIQNWTAFGITLALFLIASVGLYFFWYRNLPPEPEAETTQAEQ